MCRASGRGARSHAHHAVHRLHRAQRARTGSRGVARQHHGTALPRRRKPRRVGGWWLARCRRSAWRADSPTFHACARVSSRRLASSAANCRQDQDALSASCNCSGVGFIGSLANRSRGRPRRFARAASAQRAGNADTHMRSLKITRSGRPNEGTPAGNRSQRRKFPAPERSDQAGSRWGGARSCKNKNFHRGLPTDLRTNRRRGGCPPARANAFAVLRN